MKTKYFDNIWKVALAPFSPSNYAPAVYSISNMLI